MTYYSCGRMQVSIIIPVYNVAQYIGDCIRSVMKQSYDGNIECIIVDDCGTDGSIEIAERMIDSYRGAVKFKILHHVCNRGLSVARNTGTFAASGDFLYYLDSDDEITSDCMEKLMGIVKENPKINMVQGNVYRHPIQRTPFIYVKDTIQSLAITNDDVRKCFYKNHQMYVQVWNKLFKRDFILQNNLLFKENIIHEDILWTFFLLKHLNQAYFVQDVTYHQKKRAGSITTSTDQKNKAQNYCKIYYEILSNLTPEYEHQELCHYSKSGCHRFVKFANDEPASKDVISFFLKKSVAYGCWRVLTRLVFCRLLMMFKYGWVVWVLIRRIMHPYIIYDEIRGFRTGDI